MPGLVGFQTRMPRAWAEPQLKRMVETLQHESFYVTGTWIDESVGMYVGWVARRNSFSEAGLLRSDRSDHTLIFSGEEFSDSGAAEGWKDAVPSYLARIAESDPNFPASLNGRFHGLVVDGAARSAMLFNDRYGLHRIYYHQAKDAFYFSAEAKAILAVRPELRNIVPRSLGELVSCGCVMENRTLFEGIHVLPCASKWTIRDGSLEHQGTYFQPLEWEGQEELAPEQYYEELRAAFTRNLPRYFKSKERIGISLTGGLDSRMILAWHHAPSGSLPCYTFGGTYRDCRDVIVAREVARACGQEHTVLPVGKEFLAQFPRYAERTVYLTDGCADVRRASDLYLNEQVRGIAPVRMTGNYGSEVLRGVRAFKPVSPAPGLFKEDLSPYLHQAEATYRSLPQGHPVSFAVFNQAPWHHYGLLALEETQVSLRSPHLDNDLVKTAFRAPKTMLATNDVCLRLIADGSPTLRHIPTDRDVGGTGLVGAISRRAYEFLAKAEYAYDYGMPQWVAKIDHGLAPLHLERLFLGRHKFNHYRVWYRDVLADYVREILLDPRSLSRPYIQPKQLETVVQRHLKGDWNYTNEIHTMLTFELLHRLFVDHS